MSISGSTVTDVAIPPAIEFSTKSYATRELAYVGGSLYAIFETVEEQTELTLWKLTGTTWSTVCTPDGGLNGIAALRDGSLFVNGYSADYIYDGTSFEKLPTTQRVDGAYGSKAKLFGFTTDFSGAAKVSVLVP